MSQVFYQVDAFTDVPFKGNPAAVMILPKPRDAAWYQNIATEMNLSETAFLVRRDDGSFDLRWFTPTVEVDMCGHATVASAHILFETGLLGADDEARFHTRTGLHTACRNGDIIELNFPRRLITEIPEPGGLAAALGVKPLFIGESGYGDEQTDLIVAVDSEATVRAAAPNIRALHALGPRGVIITAPATMPGYDCVSRFFAPGAGIDEDPVTGSAHCTIGPHWSEKLGKTDLLAYQASARGGTVRVHVGDTRVRLGGHAVTVFRGELMAQ